MTADALSDRVLCDLDADPDPQELARRARLRYVHDDGPGFGRRRRGKGFSYLDRDGGPLQDEAHLERIAALVLPPAWNEVWICPFSNGHLQATGRDEQGRKQYRYHDRWTRASGWVKFGRLRDFGHALPAIRARLRRDLNAADDRLRVVALMATLLDRTAIRIGNREYAEENESYGLSTLLKEHVRVRGSAVTFEFVGKSGKERRIEFKSRLLAGRLKELLKRPGERLFQTERDDGFPAVESDQINDYLHEIAPPGCTAKTFRTWHGTATAFAKLADPPPEGVGAERAATNGTAAAAFDKRKKEAQARLREAIEAAAERLGNTPAVCRSYYVHPALCDLYGEDKFHALVVRLKPKPRRGLKEPECKLLALLDRLERLRH